MESGLTAAANPTMENFKNAKTMNLICVNKNLNDSQKNCIIDPCIVWGVLDSAFMQARVRLSCSNNLIYTGLHTFWRHASPPRAAADGVD